MLLVGLTGGMGAGKSTLAAQLHERGAVIVDADQIAREVVEPGRPVLAALVDRFGPGILHADGSLHRQALADVAFATEAGTQALNAITWPAIAEEMRRQVDAVPADAVVVCDAALLLESGFGLEGEYQHVVVVEAPLDDRVDRLVARGLGRDDAVQRIAAQLSDDERREYATYVIDNSGTVADLAPQVDVVWQELTRIVAATTGNA